MQGRLISHGSGEKRIAVLFQRDGHTAEPIGPLIIQIPFDPDLIDHRLPRIGGESGFV